jgi:DNA polymerase-3 subunit beta
LPVLDHFLFQLHENVLVITATDMETVLTVSLPINSVEQEGDIAIPSKLLLEPLKEFSDLPLTFSIDTESEVPMGEISWATGAFKLPCIAADEYPRMAELNEEHSTLVISSEKLLDGVSKTVYATADDELRPAMNGVYFDIQTDSITFVASDTHKLSRYKLNNITSEKQASFILPKKPATFLKGLLAKEDSDITISFDEKRAIFNSPRFNMSCRLIEGVYPNYNSVIPTDNPRKIVVDRVEFMTAVKRIAVFSNQASNLIKLKISGNEINISASDIDFSVSANERVACNYTGEDIDIGFKSLFLIDIFANLPATDVSIELSDAERAGLFVPVVEDESDEDLLVLLMPVLLGN